MDPIDQIEERQAQVDVGAVMGRVYAGARGEGLSRLDALFVCAGWLKGMTADQDGTDGLPDPGQP